MSGSILVKFDPLLDRTLEESVVHIFDSHLKDKNGHHYEYDKSLIEELKLSGIPYFLYCSAGTDAQIRTELNGIPVFTRIIYRLFYFLPDIIANPLEFVIQNLLYWKDLRKLQLSRFFENDIVLFHTLTQNHLLGIYLWYKSFPEGKRPFLFLLLRSPSRHTVFSGIFHALPIRLLEGLGECKVKYLSDSEIVSDDFSEQLGIEVNAVPIPHLPEAPSRHFPGSGENPLVVYLGPARCEKGFHLLPGAIRSVARKYPDVRYVIQSVLHDGRAMDAARNLRQYGEKVRVADASLDSDEYYDLLETACCVLLPYDPDIYHGRTSGIFAEALAFGKPVITTRGTWMARYVERYKCGVLMEKYDSESLAKALLEYLGDSETYDKNAKEASVSWRKRHNPKQFLGTVFSLAGGNWSDKGAALFPNGKVEA